MFYIIDTGTRGSGALIRTQLSWPANEGAHGKWRLLHWVTLNFSFKLQFKTEVQFKTRFMPKSKVWYSSELFCWNIL